jgi:UDP-N-acetylglucosamine--N-acetylmuramyl-(pentapeptide) pyrophosphoryl-undecaprenol N-acetylglucosamine transferase
MEADLVSKAGIRFTTIPAAGVHGVGLKALPGNLIRLMRGLFAARAVLQDFQPDVLFFTGGYVAGPVAVAGANIPTAIFVPDIEPGLALKLLARFADLIMVAVADSLAFFSPKKSVEVTGYPVRTDLGTWDRTEAYQVFGFSDEYPTLLVTGGSLGALSINKAITAALPELLGKMQIVHITGTHTWHQFKHTMETLAPELAPRYKVYPYLHKEMGAAFSIADLVVSRAGASSIGEYPHFGIPAILVPYPHAWRYQKINADYLTQRGAAITLADEDLEEQLVAQVLGLIRNHRHRQAMRQAMLKLQHNDAADQITNQIIELARQR